MAYTEIVGDLNVTSIYQDLMKASTGQGSAYLHAKETVNAMLADKEMTASEKAVIVSQTISGIASSISTQALNAAIQIAKENRDAPYTLAKLRADTELTQASKTKTEKDTLVSTATATKIGADTDLARISGWKMQADIYSKNGINADAMSISMPILTTGILAKNTMAGDYVGAEQAKATVYSTLANAARKDGNVTITRDDSRNVISLTPTTPLADCLTGAQTLVAIRQEKAFDDNKVQHAANSSATMIGMLLSTENSSALNNDDVGLWRSAVTELNTPTA